MRQTERTARVTERQEERSQRAIELASRAIARQGDRSQYEALRIALRQQRWREAQKRRRELKGYGARACWAMKQRARLYGVPFRMTVHMASDMLERATICPVLGIALQRSQRLTDHSPTFDCFVRELGYVPGNVSVISHRANRLKSDATVAEILALAKWMTMPLHPEPIVG